MTLLAVENVTKRFGGLLANDKSPSRCRNRACSR